MASVASAQQPQLPLPNMTGSSRPANLTTDFIAGFRYMFKEAKNEDLSDDEIVEFITENWNLILEHKREGLLTQTNIDQMKQFVDDKTDAKKELEEFHAAVERWLVLHESLMSACRAYRRIELLLSSLAKTKPEFSQAPTLFPTLLSLPKIPRPNWLDPATSLTGDEKALGPNFLPMHIAHSFVYTQGIVLSPADVTQIIAMDAKRFFRVNKFEDLTNTQKKRYNQVVNGLKDLRNEVHGPGKSACEPDPLMTVLETYHFIAKLADFYEPFLGPGFDQVRALLRELRRGLQKVLNETLRETDFTKYIS